MEPDFELCEHDEKEGALMQMIEIDYFLFVGLLMIILLIGMTLGYSFTRDYRKSLEKEYDAMSEVNDCESI